MKSWNILQRIKNYFNGEPSALPTKEIAQEVKYIVTDPLPLNQIQEYSELTEEDLLDTIEVLPVDQIEEKVLQLVVVLNKFPGIYTVESCGGHKNPKIGQMAENSWMVICKFQLQDLKGLYSLEQLAYIFNTFLFSAGEKVSLKIYTREPNGLEPGSRLMFMLQGEDVEANMIANLLQDLLNAECDFNGIK